MLPLFLFQFVYQKPEYNHLFSVVYEIQKTKNNNIYS
jgi:hypothetical protein